MTLIVTPVVVDYNMPCCALSGAPRLVTFENVVAKMVGGNEEVWNVDLGFLVKVWID